MVRAFLYDHHGYLVGEPEVPEIPELPQVIIWGDDLFVAGCPAETGRPRYYWTKHFVVPETRGSSVI